MEAKGKGLEVATLGGGCFWCLEAVFDELRGVASVQSGYCGGHVAHPTYREVCDGNSGHAEVVRVSFDPDVVSYRTILEVFFTIHDPTTPDRQGNDVGSQYRSVIFTHSEQQKTTAQQVISDLNAKAIWDASIVTQVVPAEPFYVAEDYHQEYFRNNGSQPYCRVIVAPKVAKFREHFIGNLKK